MPASSRAATLVQSKAARPYRSARLRVSMPLRRTYRRDLIAAGRVPWIHKYGLRVDRGVTRTVWIDASAGIAGDMLLGALVDLGVPLETLQGTVDAVLPGGVSLDALLVRRAGLRATHIGVRVEDDEASRTWSDVRGMV